MRDFLDDLFGKIGGILVLVWAFVSVGFIAWFLSGGALVILHAIVDAVFG